VGTDRLGRQRFASYGSATADGLGALVASGLRLDDPRVAAARQWLADNFSAASHPGRYAESREHVRPALYYYYCSSLARTLAAARVADLESPSRSAPWAEAMADELLARQRTDGSWINPVVDVREDDPLVATPLAMMALACCRSSMLDDQP
jgi:squalene-hopene/tetraprenyl-beta-curcumene cyclase